MCKRNCVREKEKVCVYVCVCVCVYVHTHHAMCSSSAINRNVPLKDKGVERDEVVTIHNSDT